MLEQCAELKCSLGCKPTPDGAKCYCAAGEQPAGSTCTDVDECAESGGDVCDQKCKNTPGSFECSCVSGYERVNGTLCRAINGEFETSAERKSQLCDKLTPIGDSNWQQMSDEIVPKFSTKISS